MMYRGTDRPKERHPKEVAGILSIITFFFTRKIFLKGYKEELQEDDIYDVLEDYQSSKLGDTLEEAWKKEAKKKRPSFTKVLWNVFGKIYVTYGVIKLISRTFFMVSKPLLVGKLVSYFNPVQKDISKSSAYTYATVLIILVFLQTFVNNVYMLFVLQLAQKIRISISSLVYRKTLKLTASSMATITNGKIITIMAKDVMIFESIANYVNDIWIGIVQICVITYIMYLKIQWAAICGVGFFVLIIPLQKFIAELTTKQKQKTLTKSDARIHLLREILPIMHTIKMYVWETYFRKIVHKLRKSEISNLKKLYHLKIAILALGHMSMRISFFICIIIYTYNFENITAEKAFVVLGCYSSLQYVVNTAIPTGISLLAETKSSMKRIKTLLLATEVDEINHIYENYNEPSIKIKNVSINSLRDINLDLSAGLHGIIGSVGCGKSTLLKVLLNELPIQGSFKLNGSISYASQDSFLFHGTIKQNILFGLPFNSNRYQWVIEACGLLKDISRFVQGDQTLLSDRGANLSKGQQARINLARSIYKEADIYLLDDPLSSIDFNLSKEIFENCIKKHLSRKICLFVTTQLHFLKDCNTVILLEKGTVKKHGTYNDVHNELETFPSVIQNILDETTNINEEDTKLMEINETSKLLKSDDSSVERKKSGSVDFQVYKTYFGYAGKYKIIMLIFSFCVCQMCISYFDYFICEWINVEEKLSYQTNGTNASNHQYVIDTRLKLSFTYTILIATTIVLTVGSSFAMFARIASANEKLHSASFSKILQAPASFFDANPSGNVLNRFSKDMTTVDEHVPFLINECLKSGLMLIGLVSLTFLAEIVFLILPIVFGFLLYVCRSVYLPTSRSLKRLDGVTKSPVISHLSATLEGITTIRANKAQQIVTNEFDKCQNKHSSTAYMYMTTNRAFAFVLDFVCAVYITIAIIILMLTSDINAAIVGLVITKTFELSSILQFGMRQWAELENQMTSVERVLEYTEIDSEYTKSKKLKSWPTRGKIQYKKVQMRYPTSKALILKNIDFIAQPGQKIGIIGRTGMGKSSIFSALFRLYDLESGAIFIDDEDIKNVDLRTVRSKISIIPQNPVLFTGTLRENLDPDREFSDDELWKSLSEVLMKSVISNSGAGLHCVVGEGGANFSTGQKQLICLARAINRKNKIIVLDEVTASVDPGTAVLIEDAIRRNFYGCTLFVIAHKLSSILDMDKIMVIDNGTIMEFDDTIKLLNDENSTFYHLITRSGIVKK